MSENVRFTDCTFSDDEDERGVKAVAATDIRWNHVEIVYRDGHRTVYVDGKSVDNGECRDD